MIAVAPFITAKPGIAMLRLAREFEGKRRLWSS